MRRKDYRTLNFRLSPELEKKFAQKTPHKGDKTRVLTNLVTLFVNGVITIDEKITIRHEGQKKDVDINDSNKNVTETSTTMQP